MKTAIFHSVNAGLYFWDGSNGLLVDAVHEGRDEGLSPMPVLLMKQMCHRTGIFKHLTGVLFTHLHHDHFDAERVQQLQQVIPGLPVYGPNLLCGGAKLELIQPGSYLITMAGISVLALDTRHDGEVFSDTPHQSFLLSMRNECFFVAGDALLDVPDAARVLKSCPGPVKAAFCNLYQLALPSGRAFLRALAPEQIFLYHLPFPEDDHCSYHRLARQVIRTYPADLPPVRQLRHMAWLDEKPAMWTN